MTENTLKKYTIPFAQTPRHIVNHTKLSWKAKGLMTYLLDKPDNWKFSIQGIMAQGAESKTSIRTGLAELEKYGFLRITRVKDCATGRYTGWLWEITIFSNNFSEIGFSALGDSDVGESATSNTQDTTYPKKKEKKREHSADASALCQFFISKVKEKKSDFSKDSISQEWYVAADKLLKLRGIDDLKKLIAFAVNSSFWLGNILSMPKLLKHLDTLEVQMRTGKAVVDVEQISKRKQWAKKNEWSTPGGYATAEDDMYVMNGIGYKYDSTDDFWKSHGL